MSWPIEAMWNDEDIATLTRMWDEGSTALAIARVIGKSRNAVIGKVHRLSLSDRCPQRANAKARQREEKAKKPKQPRMRVKARPVPQRALSAEPRPRPMRFSTSRVTIMDLLPGDCRMPLWFSQGTMAITEKFFCARPVIEGTSWCLECTRKTHQPWVRVARDLKRAGPWKAAAE